MSARKASSITQLLKASYNDESALRYPLPDGIFGFLAQQAVEKLFKALLAGHGQAYPFSHDLLLLRSLVEAEGEQLPSFTFPLQDLSEFAGQFRYDEPIPLDDLQRDSLRRDVGALREFCIRRLAELGIVGVNTSPGTKSNPGP